MNIVYAEQSGMNIVYAEQSAWISYILNSQPKYMLNMNMITWIFGQPEYYYMNIWWQQAQEEAFTDSSDLQAASAQLGKGGREWRWWGGSSYSCFLLDFEGQKDQWPNHIHKVNM